ncbi:serine hydrolase domain-containing protein [Streptomyces sp. CA-111067]|uniref:serine hydrolase domain-containing protein n=1 Tax=Streptomyces sp. CA-111067 TaxID=3240046 RepID=UPI003D99D3ED
MTAEQAALRGPLERAMSRVTAPDVVLAVSRGGERTVLSGGTAAADPDVPREDLSYELGSLSKTFTVLLLAALAADGVLGLDDPLAAHLPELPLGSPHARAITLRHLATHTSCLPRVPRDLLPAAVLHPRTNAYAGYGPGRLTSAFAATPVRRAPGTRWRYSNFALALLGAALEHTTATPYPALLAQRVLIPLGLTATTALPPTATGTAVPPAATGTAGPATATGAALPPTATGTAVPPAATGTAGPARLAVGHRADGRTPLPATEMAAFTPAGGVRATPGDLLGYAEALLDPDRGPLGRALREVQVPALRRGLGHRHTHTLTWYLHPAAAGPLLFHAGATFGQQSFLGFHPATGTAVIGFATRHDRTWALTNAAYALLQELSAAETARPRPGPRQPPRSVGLRENPLAEHRDR